MNAATPSTLMPVSPEEVVRRIDEYRRGGYEKQAMPHVVYQDPFIVCPWPGCGFRIVAIDFQIEQANDPALYKAALAAWWQGPGIAARCPGCGKYVLFSVTEKRCVADADLANLTVLPDDWQHQAHIVN